MNIAGFHLKFTSAREQGHLFQALRNLSQVDDFRSMFGATTDWLGWPPAAVSSVSKA